jgi:hypothetical protein
MIKPMEIHDLLALLLQHSIQTLQHTTTFALDPTVDDNRQALFEPKPAVEACYGPTLITMTIA